MFGGGGGDTYVVDRAGDVVREVIAAGIDTVQSSVSYVLGPNVERLTLTGTAPINGTGNGLANLLTGNAAANRLSGGAGNDTLIGGAGADVMTGGAGNDLYVVDRATDRVVEGSNGGIDHRQLAGQLHPGRQPRAAHAQRHGGRQRHRQRRGQPADGQRGRQPAERRRRQRHPERRRRQRHDDRRRR
jgi:Ca2+-binding RTX toxin-like protein